MDKGGFMKKAVFILFALMFFVEISVAQNIDELRSKIDEMNNIIVKAMIESDIETMLEIYSDNVLSLPSYQPMLRGIDEVRLISQLQIESGWRTTYFNLVATDILPAGNFIIEIGNYEMIMSPPDSDEEWPDNGKYITVWEIQKDGSLKIRIETWNTDTNPWEGMYEEPGFEEDYPEEN